MSNTYVVHRPWTLEDQAVYLRQAYEEYKLRNGDPVRPPDPFTWDKLTGRFDTKRPLFCHCKNINDLAVLYRIGHEGGMVRMSYPEFESAVMSGAKPTCCRRHFGSYYVGCGRDDYDHWYPRRGSHYRQRVPLRITEPKQLTEQEVSIQDWRDRKGFDRYRSHWKLRARKWFRTQGHREMRRWEKQRITKGDYEALADQNTSTKMFLDPWRWD